MRLHQTGAEQTVKGRSGKKDGMGKKRIERKGKDL